jgi:hypothetical protein
MPIVRAQCDAEMPNSKSQSGSFVHMLGYFNTDTKKFTADNGVEVKHYRNMMAAGGRKAKSRRNRKGKKSKMRRSRKSRKTMRRR